MKTYNGDCAYGYCIDVADEDDAALQANADVLHALQSLFHKNCPHELLEPIEHWWAGNLSLTALRYLDKPASDG